MRKAALHNLGCKVNAYETEAMEQGIPHDIGFGPRRKVMFRDAGDRGMTGQSEGAKFACGQQGEKNQNQFLHFFDCV